MNRIKLIIFCVSTICLLGCRDNSRQASHHVEESFDSTAVDTVSLPIQVKAKHLTIQDGLPSITINSLSQDKKGFIWFGTRYGLARYDGNKIKVYRHNNSPMSIDDSRIKKTIEDAANNKMWLYTVSETFECLDLKTGTQSDYMSGEKKPHFTNSKFVNAGEIWMYGKKNGAMRVCLLNGKFYIERFGKDNIESDEIEMFDTVSKNKILICTPTRLYIYSKKKLICANIGNKFVKTRYIAGRQMLVTDKGKLYELKGNKTQVWLKIAFDKGEHFVDDVVWNGKWMIFTNLGCYSVDIKKSKVERCSGEWDIANGKIVKDNRGRKWIYNKTGELRLITEKGLISLNLLPSGETNYIDYERYHIVEDNHGLIWISTYGNGLFVFSHDLKHQQHFIADGKTDSPITSNHIMDMIADRNDGVWIGTEFGGVAHIQVLEKTTERLFPDNNRRMDFSNTVRMISKSKNGDILVATRAGWLYRYSSDMKQMKGKSHYDSNVYAIKEARDGQTWIGTRGKGIYGVNGLDFGNHNVFCMAEDNKNRMWVGTYGDGLSAVMKQDKKYFIKKIFLDSVGTNEVRCIIKDRNGWIWVGTTGGLLVFNPDKFIFDKNAYIQYLTGKEIHDIFVDSKNRIWLAIPEEGICVTTSKNGYDRLKFKCYNHLNGLVNDMTQCVVEDRKGDYWISTQQGVSCFNLRRKTFENYSLDPSPMGNMYNENAAICLDDGRILLGGYYGLTIIQPGKLRHAKDNVNVVFTSEPYSDMMTLDYSDNSPVIDFSTLDYSDVKNVKYTYWLEGYDKTWSGASPISWAAYKNLPSGKYILHAKACNADGVWGSESVLTIMVNPPMYLSFWAILLYIVIAVVVMYLIVRNVREKNELRSKVKFEQELIKYKLLFFTNIAHEFRTPLTLIEGSLEKETRIVKANNWHGELDKSIRTMNKSVKRMLRLIDQLLEFRKMQAGKLALALQQSDVVNFVKNLALTFEDAADSKKIDYKFTSSENTHVMFFDKQHLDKIVFNLLSNAFKYTPSNGAISLEMSFDDGMMTIKVIDSGVGVPGHRRNELFSRFMQSSYTGESFGIGLHLTKELVAVHHGTIDYEKNPCGGSIFIVKIPTDVNVYEKHDFLVQNNPILRDDEDTLQFNELADVPETAKKRSKPLNRKKILFVEDDNDIREFLGNELSNYFEVEIEADGKSCIEKAKEYDVDLIISDVMMPGMNGFELTKRLKNNFETSHIPIILLTALSNDESQLEGMESGADAYITKPFSPQLLIARIFQLLNGREILKQKYSKSLEEVRPSLCSSEQDQLFVRRLDAIITSRMSDQTLSVERIAEMLHLGRTIFYNKVRGVTGYTPNEYLRVKRMKYAAELLKKGEKNVSEVAYEVGFDTPYYFSKCFKDQFGIPPSQYRGG